MGEIARLLLLATVLGLSNFASGQQSAPLAPNSPPGQPNVHTGFVLGPPASPCAIVPNGKAWRDGAGQFRTLADLRSILTAHNAWAWNTGSGKRADLTNAELCSLDLHDLNLREAELNHSKFVGSNLQHSDFMGADLSQADFTRADLRNTSFTETSLIKATLMESNLQGALIVKSDLTSANLLEADLRGAVFRWSKLNNASLSQTNASGTTFWQVDLEGAALYNTELAGASLVLSNMDSVKFEPISLPEIRGFPSNANLEKLTYNGSPIALTLLRKQFQDGGYITQDREITYALRHTESRKKHFVAAEAMWACASLRRLVSAQESEQLQRMYNVPATLKPCSYREVLSDWIDYGFDYFFDWACRYGMEPNRCWKLLLWTLLAAASAYFIVMHLPTQSGIYRIDDASRPGDLGQRISLQMKQAFSKQRYVKYVFRFLRAEIIMLYYAVFFSLMSAFNIGFRDINFGRWIRLLTIREYDLKARGWVRPIAGIQALFSAAMVALWFLSYFGRPFAQ